MGDQDIPIDIHTNKLLEWLISRRHCKKNWYENILSIREKINKAIQDMPEDSRIVKLLSGAHINYFHCLKIIEILKDTEKDTKNVFGRYGSQRMKDWNEIVSLYQKDNLYLAEGAQILIRNTAYEIPSLKKQLQKLESLENDYHKKERDYIKSETMANNEFIQNCKQLGIPGVDIRKELLNLLKELPDLYKNVATKLHNLQNTLDLYNEFLDFNSNKNYQNTSSLISYLIKNGNTTVYEYVYGEKPLKIDEPKPDDIIKKEPSNNANEIEFGHEKLTICGSEVPSIEGNINLDFEVNCQIDCTSEREINIEGYSNTTVDIDWGTEEKTNFNNDNIDFNISLEESGIVVEQSGLDGGVACGNEALTLLDNPETRNKVIDELYELQAFLKLRLYELSNEGSFISFTVQNTSELTQIQSVESISCMLDSVEAILSDLTNKRVSHLHNMRHSTKYIDVLVASLNQRSLVSDRARTSRQEVSNKAAQCQRQVKEVLPVLRRLQDNTSSLSEQLQREISNKYNHRIVNIIGGVKNI